jgi:plasmid stabilization system protein ParE
MPWNTQNTSRATASRPRIVSLEGVDASLVKLLENPGRGHLRETMSQSLAGLRIYPVTGFPNHLLFYRVFDDGTVRVLRIRHGAMDADLIDIDE